MKSILFKRIHKSGAYSYVVRLTCRCESEIVTFTRTFPTRSKAVHWLHYHMRAAS